MSFKNQENKNNNVENQEYEDNIVENKKDLNESTKKFLSYFKSPLRYFSLIITFYLIMSYISNKYIGGLFINFFPMFLPVGKSFYPKPVLTSIFHPPLENKNSEFFKKIELTAGKEKDTKTYYELLKLGGTIKQIVFGLFESTSSVASIDNTKIFLADYNNLWWYQKIIVCIFGGFQILIGTVMTVFSLFAFLFSGKHGAFLNLLKAQKNNNIQLKPLTESILETNSDKQILKNGFSKFAAFFDFTYFIPVDKLSYGSTFFFREKPSFKEKFSYFFLVVVVLLLIGILRSSNVGGIIGLIILIILMGGFILNPNKIIHPYANYYGLKTGVKSNDPNQEVTFNQIKQKMDNVSNELNKLMTNFSKEAKKEKNTLTPPEKKSDDLKK